MKKTYKRTTKQVIEAIESARGLVSLAAERLGITRQALEYWIREKPEVKLALDNARARQLDVVEARLFQAINDGEMAAIIFYLKTIGKNRGYVERQETGGTINVVFEYADEPTNGANPEGETP